LTSRKSSPINDLPNCDGASLLKRVRIRAKMSSSKGLLRHLPLPLRLWSNCSPLSVITRQTAPSVSVSQGIVNCGIFSRGLASLVNGQAKPLNSRRDNGRPMPIGIRRYVIPSIIDFPSPPFETENGERGSWDLNGNRPTPH
jgi:hypothetical protein